MNTDKKNTNLPITLINWFRRLSGVKKGILIGILVILTSFSYFTLNKKNSSKTQYQFATATKGTIISTVTDSGNVSGNQTNIYSPSTGIIEEIYVKNGDHVSAGDPLFKVRSTATEQEKASLFASYENAVNTLATARSNQRALDATMWTAQKAYLDAQNTENYKNDNIVNPSTRSNYTDLEKNSIDSGLVQAQKNFQAAEQKYKDAGISITAAQASLQASWLAYQETQNATVTAPVDGTVANLSASIHSTVNAGGGNNTTAAATTNSNTSTSGSVILALADLSNLQVKVQASEVDVPQVKEGDKATITLDAFPGKTFIGEVRHVDTFGTTTSGVVTYNVYVVFLDPPADILPGMTSSVMIQTNKKDGVIKVPTTAIQNNNGDSYVRVLKNGSISQVPVETGVVSDSETEIVSGLMEGDTVVTSVSTTSSSNVQSSPFSAFGARGFGGSGTRGGR